MSGRKAHRCPLDFSPTRSACSNAGRPSLDFNRRGMQKTGQGEIRTVTYGSPQDEAPPVKPRGYGRTDVILLSLNANERQSRGGNAISVTAFLEARDFLLSCREDYDKAWEEDFLELR
jgi:hypothetical protein